MCIERLSVSFKNTKSRAGLEEREENTPVADSTSDCTHCIRPRRHTRCICIITTSYNSSYCILALWFADNAFSAPALQWAALWCSKIQFLALRNMSAVFFDLSEAMCQLCKAGVSGSVERRGGLRWDTWNTSALKKKKTHYLSCIKKEINRQFFVITSCKAR